MKEKKIIPVCPKCGSKEIRARIKTGELWCRRCGYIGEKKSFFKIIKLKIVGGILYYKKLWEGLKEVDGHRKLKPYSKYPDAEYKTIKECMDNIEELHKMGKLQGMIDNRWQN